MALPLPATIAATNAPDNRVRIGIVNSVNPLIVNVQGTPIPMGRASTFFPQVGQAVSVVRQDGTWMAMDRTQASSDPAPRFQSGSVIMTVTGAGSATIAVLFNRPFASIPTVMGNIDSGSGPTSGWQARPITLTTTGFTMFIFGSTSTFTVGVTWQAMERTQ